MHGVRIVPAGYGAAGFAFGRGGKSTPAFRLDQIRVVAEEPVFDEDVLVVAYGVAAAFPRPRGFLTERPRGSLFPLVKLPAEVGTDLFEILLYSLEPVVAKLLQQVELV